MDEESTLFSKQFTGNTCLYFFLYQYRQPLYLIRNLEYLHLKRSEKQLVKCPQRGVGSFLFEKELGMKDSRVWMIYISHLKIRIS